MNLIYQYWNGVIPNIARFSRSNIEEYAKIIGADYRFDHNENFSKTFCRDPKYFGLLRPVYDQEFHRYDRVLFLDSDVFVKNGVTENIFDEPISDFGMCEEPHQPELRASLSRGICGSNDERWASLVKDRWSIEVPRDSRFRPRVYNTGVVMFSGSFLKRAKSVLIPPQTYIDTIKEAGLPSFYAIDQNYLHAMAFMSGIEFTKLDQEWNRQIHYTGPSSPNRPVYDERNEKTKFVHVQLSCSNDWEEDRILNTVNQ